MFLCITRFMINYLGHFRMYATSIVIFMVLMESDKINCSIFLEQNLDSWTNYIFEEEHFFNHMWQSMLCSLSHNTMVWNRYSTSSRYMLNHYTTTHHGVRDWCPCYRLFFGYFHHFLIFNQNVLFNFEVEGREFLLLFRFPLLCKHYIS